MLTAIGIEVDDWLTEESVPGTEEEETDI